MTFELTEKSNLPKRWEEEIMYRGSCMVVQHVIIPNNLLNYLQISFITPLVTVTKRKPLVPTYSKLNCYKDLGKRIRNKGF